MTPAEATQQQAEMTLLAQAMTATELSLEQIEEVRPDDLQDRRHQFIWRTILDELKDGGRDCPSLVVIDRLRKMGAIETSGGVDYIESFDALFGSRALGSLSRAIESVLECSRMHKISEVAKEVAASADGYSSAAALSGLRAALDTIEDNKQTRVMPALDALTTGLDDAFKVGIRTGTPLDRRIDLTPGRMYVLGGRPGHGKTTLTLQLVLHMLAENPEAVVLFASCEMTETELALKALCCIEGHDYITPLRALGGAGQNTVKLAAATRSGILKRLFVKPSRSIDDVCADAHRIHRTTPLTCVVVDYLSAFSAPSGTISETRTREVGAVSRECKSLAQRLNCVVLAASQLNRASKASAVPTLVHLRDSGEIEQDADGVMLLHRPDHDDENAVAQLLIAKNRWGELGTVHLTPDLGAHRFGWSGG